jgi:hypothetical protein
MSATETKTRLVAIADVPSDQRFTWRLTPLPGRLLNAETVGETLAAVCRILTSHDKTGREVFPALMGVRIAATGAFEADIAILEIEADPMAVPEQKE